MRLVGRDVPADCVEDVALWDQTPGDPAPGPICMAKPILEPRDRLAAAQPLNDLAHRLVVVRVNLVGKGAR